MNNPTRFYTETEAAQMQANELAAKLRYAHKMSKEPKPRRPNLLLVSSMLFGLAIIVIEILVQMQ